MSEETKACIAEAMTILNTATDALAACERNGNRKHQQSPHRSLSPSL